jgi:DNA-directed RNA polymerase subunit RPC12/RpoP
MVAFVYFLNLNFTCLPKLASLKNILLYLDVTSTAHVSRSKLKVTKMSEYEFIPCARCGKAETKEKAAIKCSNCDAGYHLTCLKNDTSGFLGDAFFTLKCSSCSDTEEDTLFREKNQW